MLQKSQKRISNQMPPIITTCLRTKNWLNLQVLEAQEKATCTHVTTHLEFENKLIKYFFRNILFFEASI